MNDGVCPICKGAEYIGKNVPITHPDFGKLYPCECARLKIETRSLERALGASGMPPDQLGMTFNSFKPERAVKLQSPHRNDEGYEVTRVRVRIQTLKRCKVSLPEHVQTAKARCLEFACNPQGFLTLIGEPGCGKSHLAAAIGNHRLKQGHFVSFAVVPDLLDHLRATFNPKAGISYDVRFEAYKTVGLLILDDLGTERGTPFANEKIYQLINHRYNWQLPLVITSNDLPTDLDVRLQSRLFDRRRNTVFEILAGDYRTLCR